MEEPAYPEASWALTLFVGGMIVLLTALHFPKGAMGYDYPRIDSPYLLTAFACLAFPSAFLDPRGMRLVGIFAPLLSILIEILHHAMHKGASAEHFVASILGIGFGVGLGRFFRWAIITRNL